MGDLHSCWSTLTSPVRIGSRTISADDLDARVVCEPLGERLGSAIRKQIKASRPLQVNDDRSVGLSSPHRPVVNANDSGLGSLLERRLTHRA
jgi:hypothetical protein